MKKIDDSLLSTVSGGTGYTLPGIGDITADALATANTAVDRALTSIPSTASIDRHVATQVDDGLESGLASIRGLDLGWARLGARS